MQPAPFDYVRAESWTDAVGLLSSDGDARVIAGGQSLVPMMMLRLSSPSLLVDLGGIERPGIEVRDGLLVLSALTRHVELERSELVRASCPMLSEAAAQIGNIRVRHRGTIGGSLANAESSAELACVAVAHQASINVLGPEGVRVVPAAELFVSELVTSLAPGELITSIEVPVLRTGQGSSFVELARRAGDFALVEVAALLTLDGELRVSAARLVVSATGDRPADHSDGAASLYGRAIDEQGVNEVAQLTAASAQVRPHVHAGPAYRRSMVEVLVRRALTRAGARAELMLGGAGGAG
jgi:CO/xanthine dehydrogenase FAD-binding subunit